MTKEQWYALGKRLRQIRRHQDLTSQDLADQAKIQRVIISTLENQYKRPGKEPRRVSFDAIFGIAEALDVSLDYLAGKKDEKK